MKIVSAEIMMMDAGAPPNRAVCRPVYCRLHTDEGVYGDGEAGVMMMTGAPAVFEMLIELCKRIIGKNPLEQEVILHQLRQTTYFARNGGPIVQATFAAIDIALWDIKGKALNVPVYQLLGGKLNASLRCYASQINYGWGTLDSDAVTPEEYAARAHEAILQGYDAVKADFFELSEDGTPVSATARRGLLPASYMRLITRRVAAVREAIGDGDLIVECHGYTDTMSSMQIAKEIEPYHIAYMEEPEETFYPTLQKLSQSIPIRLAAGERLFSRKEYLPYLQNQVLQVIQPDIGNCGGITETWKITDLANLYDIGIQLHCAGSPICMAATLQLEAAIPNFLIHEHCCVQDRDYIKKLAIYDYLPDHGHLTVPDRPGIGNELSDLVLKTSQKVIVS